MPTSNTGYKASFKSILDSILKPGKWHWSRGFSSAHDAWDIGAPTGTPVYAVAAGVVAYAKDARKQADKGASGWAMGGGNVVDVDVGKSLWTQYAHLDSIVVREGQRVEKGQLLGYVGSTGGGAYDPKTGTYSSYGGPGSSFGAKNSHLHFAIVDKAARKFINPETGLKRIGDTSGPTGGFSNPDKNVLGGWNNAVQFPTGHLLNAADVESIIAKLKSTNDPSTGKPYIGSDIPGALSEYSVRKILTSYIGQPWNKTTQDNLQNSFNAAAANSDVGAALGGLGDALGIGQALDAFGSTIGKLVFYTLGAILVIAGLFLYSRNASDLSIPSPGVPV